MRLLVAIATYNEIENLPTLVAAIRESAPNADILVVDDNSPDGTGAWCDTEAAQSPGFRVIHRAGKMGLGSAAWAAMRDAIDRRYELLTTMDADWSHPPDALPRLLAAAQEADVVIGSRYCPGGRIEGWPLTRRILSRGVNFGTRLAMGLPVNDASTAYRVYRVEKLREVDFSALSASGYAYLEELLAALARTGARFVEVPITFTERRAGRSKISFDEALGKVRVMVRHGAKRLAGRTRYRHDAG